MFKDARIREGRDHVWAALEADFLTGKNLPFYEE
jgi:hypothetical protein